MRLASVFRTRTWGARGARLAVLTVVLCAASGASAADKMSFWDSQHRGANYFTEQTTDQWFVDAVAANIRFVRVAPASWKAEGRDFLLGDADEFKAIPQGDFDRLKAWLDKADAAGIKVVLVMLSLPGDRWRQHNGDQGDFRLWRDLKYHAQAAAFWKELAGRLAGHPAVVGYDILNEPFPERSAGFTLTGAKAVAEWYAGVQGTPADLNLFYSTVVAAIREVDKDTPIVLACGSWADPRFISYLKPLKDDRVIYSFHMGEPFAFTNRKQNNGRFTYPGKVTFEGDSGDETHEMDEAFLETYLDPVVDWQKKHGIPSNRVWAAEFGCHRMAGGAQQYLSDLIHIFNARGWHWAFYAFRGDGWDGMDYEVGTKGLGEAYWQAVERGEKPPLPRSDNPLWEVFKRELKP